MPDRVHKITDLLFKQSVKTQRGRSGQRHVRHIAAGIGENLQLRIEAHSAARSEQLHFPGVFFQIQAETRLHAQYRAVLVADERSREVLHIAQIGVRLGCRRICDRLFQPSPVAQLAESRPVHGNGFGIPHEITGQIDDVHAQIDERTAARPRLVAEPAARVSVPAQIRRFGIVNLSKRAAIDKIAHDLRIVSESSHEPDHEFSVARLCRIEHLLRLLRVERHGLFAENVFSRPKRLYRTRHMRAVPRAYAHRVDFGQRGEHLPFVRIETADAPSLPRRFQAVGVNIAERVKLCVLILQVSGNVRIGNASRSDHGNLDFTHLQPPLRRIRPENARRRRYLFQDRRRTRARS